MTSPEKTPPPQDLFPIHALRASATVLTGILLFPVVAGFVAAAAPRLAVLQHRSPQALAANHLVTLGWGTLVAVGALQQMLPAAAGAARTLNPRVPAQVIVHTVGTALIALGFTTGAHSVVLAGGAAVAVSVAMVLAAAAGIMRSRRRTLPVMRFAAAALVCLAATVLWGLVLAANRRLVFSLVLLGPGGLVVHLALGLVGWFGLLIIGMSYYLVPRFLGLANAAPGHQTMVFSALGVATIAIVGGVLTAGLPSFLLTRGGMLLIGAGGLLYAVDLARLIRAWRGPRPDITRAHWRVLLVETTLLATGSTAWAFGLLPGSGTRWGVAGVALFLLGWVTLAITGQAYKVTPFLMWYYRFYAGLTAYDVPRLDAPYWPRAALPPFGMLAAAGPLVAVGVLTGSPPVAATGGLLFFVGATWFSALLGYSWLLALRVGRRP